MVSFEVNQYADTTPPIKVEVWTQSAAIILGDRRIALTITEFRELCERGLAELDMREA